MAWSDDKNYLLVRQLMAAFLSFHDFFVDVSDQDDESFPNSAETIFVRYSRSYPLAIYRVTSLRSHMMDEQKKLEKLFRT